MIEKESRTELDKENIVKRNPPFHLTKSYSVKRNDDYRLTKSSLLDMIEPSHTKNGLCLNNNEKVFSILSTLLSLLKGIKLNEFIYSINLIHFIKVVVVVVVEEGENPRGCSA